MDEFQSGNSRTRLKIRLQRELMRSSNACAFGNRMDGKFVNKLAGDLFELRVKQFDRIFRILFFYQSGRVVVVTSGFQKKTEQTPPAEIVRAERLKRLWLKYRNRYPVSQRERDAPIKEWGI
jgi:phage-related protein